MPLHTLWLVSPLFCRHGGRKECLEGARLPQATRLLQGELRHRVPGKGSWLSGYWGPTTEGQAPIVVLIVLIIAQLSMSPWLAFMWLCTLIDIDANQYES